MFVLMLYVEISIAVFNVGDNYIKGTQRDPGAVPLRRRGY